jgi:hypothetical protein
VVRRFSFAAEGTVAALFTLVRHTHRTW